MNNKNVEPKVSIIVPIHNAGKYLYKCLDSLINQTLDEIEIILVLDCPTDGSDQVADDYARKDSRIKIVKNKENLHIGFSRNEGLKIATGEYIGFTDHDDYCELNMFEELYKTAKNENAEVVLSDSYDETIRSINYYGFPIGLFKQQMRDEILKALIRGKSSVSNTRTFDNVNSVWNQLFNRKFLLKNDIWFVDNKKYSFEDAIFNIEVYLHLKEVVYTPKAFYHHIRHQHNFFDSKAYKRLGQYINYLEYVQRILMNEHLLGRYQNEYSECILRRLYTSNRSEIKNNGILSIFKNIADIKKNEILQTGLKVFFTHKKMQRKLPLTKRMFLYLITKK